jgi:hypothetical protein
MTTMYEASLGLETIVFKIALTLLKMDLIAFKTL